MTAPCPHPFHMNQRVIKVTPLIQEPAHVALTLWNAIGEMFGEALVLGGGTALAARWQHRVSTDVDFFLPPSALQTLSQNETQKVTDTLLEIEGVREDRTWCSPIAINCEILGPIHGGLQRVALEALKEVDTVQGIAQRNGLHPNQVSAWKRQAADGAAGAFESGSGKRGEDHEATVRELHAKIGELTMERIFFRGFVGMDSIVRAGGREPLVAVLYSGGRERGEFGADEADGRAAHGLSVLLKVFEKTAHGAVRLQLMRNDVLSTTNSTRSPSKDGYIPALGRQHTEDGPPLQESATSFSECVYLQGSLRSCAIGWQQSEDSLYAICSTSTLPIK